MNSNDLVSPKTFISYSWTTSEHEEWVIDLATRLMSDGVEVILDKWDLKEGHDIHRFMESMVHKESSIDKVLIICDRGYKEKADNRQGGVGVESQIITPQIYNDVKQEKFIPIVAEREIDGNHLIPTYIASRLYIDLSSSDIFEENYEKLLRSIYNKPMYLKPTLGKPPSFLLDEALPKYLTTPILTKLKIASEKFPYKMPLLWSEFEDNLFDTLEELRINVQTPDSLEDLIIEKIQLLIPLRNDFVDAVELLIVTNSLESSMIIEFFEKIFDFTEFQGSGIYNKLQFDHYKFFIVETFLYLVTILLKYKKYKLISEIINTDFYFKTNISRHKDGSFVSLSFYLESLEVAAAKTNPRRLSIHADLIDKYKHKKFGNALFETDLILYYISKINPRINYWVWFPVTYIYLSENIPIRFLANLKSTSHFEEVKSIFGVQDEADLADKISNFELDKGFSGPWHSIPHPSQKIDLDKLCTLI